MVTVRLMVLPFSSDQQNTSYGRFGSWVHRSYSNLRLTRGVRGGASFRGGTAGQGGVGAGRDLDGQFEEAGRSDKVDLGNARWAHLAG